MYLPGIFVLLLLNCVYGNEIERRPELPQEPHKNHTGQTLVGIGDGFYWFEPGLYYNWFEADEYCRRIRMTLACLETKEEDDLINNYILENFGASYWEWWIGANDLAQEGRYVWHARGEAVTYTNWRADQPHNVPEENCIDYRYGATNNKFEWGDYFCYNTLPFFCEEQKCD